MQELIDFHSIYDCFPTDKICFPAARRKIKLTISITAFPFDAEFRFTNI